MGRAVTGFWWSPTAEGTPALVVTAAFFALGGLAGCLMALGAAEGGMDALQIYLENFLTSAREGAIITPATPEILWRLLRWPLAALLLGFTALGLDKVDAGTATSVSLVLLSALLTGLNLYNKLGRYGGAGTLVPITGFANAVVSPAIDFKSEGFVTGMAAKMFTVAGPVIVFGVTASVIYGVVLMRF